jgi:hypothetical protein
VSVFYAVGIGTKKVHHVIRQKQISEIIDFRAKLAGKTADIALYQSTVPQPLWSNRGC